MCSDAIPDSHSDAFPDLIAHAYGRAVGNAFIDGFTHTFAKPDAVTYCDCNADCCPDANAIAVVDPDPEC